MSSIIFKNNRLFYLDQTKLPFKENWQECSNLRQAYWAIKSLRVRGAPLIGVFASYALYIGIKDLPLSNKDRFFARLNKAIDYLKNARPTAVNLFWALERIAKCAYNRREKSVREIKEAILREAKLIHSQDLQLCARIAKYGIKLIKDGERILTHCNTGFLATAGQGTALGIIYEAAKVYKNIRVIATETRPLLQGARLTCWELLKKRVKVTLICDNMVGFFMQKGMVDKVIVGADRITTKGDVANKIGTYNLAVVAKYHKIPFYVAAPSSSFDLKLEEGAQIPIEERDVEEVKKVVGRVYIAPWDVEAYNPAFDITPHRLITAIITDKGIIKPPYRENIKRVFYG
jgi:methylthioribose-1-phosphate isomerase